MVSLSDVLAIDRDLGLGNRPTSSRAAVVLYRPIDEGQESSTQEVAATIVRIVKAWAIDVLQPWAETHSMGALAIRVTSAVATQCIDLAAVDLQLLRAI
jgi:hypothetical protein